MGSVRLTAEEAAKITDASIKVHIDNAVHNIPEEVFLQIRKAAANRLDHCRIPAGQSHDIPISYSNATEFVAMVKTGLEYLGFTVYHVAERHPIGASYLEIRWKQV